MPVRIYDIAKKLGIESKEVLVKAKELGITGARVPSSSLDKITAAYLEEQLGGVRPKPLPQSPTPSLDEKIIIVSESAPTSTAVVVASATEAQAEVPTAIGVAAAPVPAEPLPKKEEPPALAAEAAKPEIMAPPTPSPILPPPPPPPPKAGDKVGFIQLPTKAAPRVGDRAGSVKAPPRSAPVARTDFTRRGDIRSVRGGMAPPGAPPLPTQKTTAPARAPEPPKTPTPQVPALVPPATGEVISLKPPIIIRELAEHLKRKPHQIIADLIDLNVFATVNQAIDETLAQKVCSKYGFRFEVEKRERGAGLVHAPVKKVDIDIDDKPEDLRLRAPVVTIMGHVDHGKTSLLDVIRKSNVAAGEAGGITQHIGAYTISFPHPERKDELQQITFLDTPGHAAFSAMRARGANVTDLVVLVVAANDGVMPQTLEALSHAKAAKVPILVAVNKIDHPNANSLKVRQQLQDKGLVPDDWGGDTIFVDVSALTKQGVDKLLEMVLLQAELLELKANPNRPAKGNVIESGLEPGGPTATLLVRKGTLRIGQFVLCGEYYGKVRALINEEGNRLKEAGPSFAVKMLGLNAVPEAGLEFTVVEDEKTARELAGQRADAARIQDKESRAKITLENLFDTLAATSSKVLKVVVKADTQGSVEAIVDALKKIEADQVALEIVHSAVGTITESDALLASASQAIIIGFHTRIDSSAAEVAKREGVQIKLYAIIYELIDEVKQAMVGLLEPILKETIIGAAEVRKIFELSKGGTVAGCVVTNGRLVRGKARVMRRKNLVYEGVIQTLRRFQDEVNEVRSGMECGIRIEGFNDFLSGDAIECYSLEKITQKL